MYEQMIEHHRLELQKWELKEQEFRRLNGEQYTNLVGYMNAYNTLIEELELSFTLRPMPIKEMPFTVKKDWLYTYNDSNYQAMSDGVVTEANLNEILEVI